MTCEFVSSRVLFACGFTFADFRVSNLIGF